MTRSPYRSGLALGLALVLTLGAASCSKKDATTTDAGASTTTAAPAAGGSKGTVAGAATPKKGPACAGWPASAGQQPEAMKQPDAQGFFIWQDVGGWHVRARGTASKEPFKGTIRGSRDMTSAKENPAGGGAKIDLKGNVVTFEIPPSNDLKGFDLVAGCLVDQLQFALLVGPNPAPADSIYVGGQGKAVSPVFIEQRY